MNRNTIDERKKTDIGTGAQMWSDVKASKKRVRRTCNYFP